MNGFTPATDPLNRKAVRAGVRSLISGGGYTHALTLNPNQGSLTFGRVRDLFGRFCLEVDRFRHGKLRVNKLYTAERLDAIATVEKLEANTHLHVAANFKKTYFGRAFEPADERKLTMIWREVTRGSGSFHMSRLSDGGWAAYITKEFTGSDPDYILAADFHPNDKVVYSLPAFGAN